MNEQEEALLLDYVEGGLKGAELDRARSMLAADAELAARVEAMRADREGVRALGEATATAGAVHAAGALPGAVQAALAKWSLGAASSSASTAGFVGPSPAGEDVPSENHVWQPKKPRRIWHVELIVAYGGIAAMLVVGAVAVLSPDGESPGNQNYSDRMPSMTIAPDAGKSLSAPMELRDERADGVSRDVAKDEKESPSGRIGAESGGTASLARKGERDTMLESVQTHGSASRAEAAPTAAAPASPSAPAVAATPGQPAPAASAAPTAKPSDKQLAMSDVPKLEDQTVDVLETKKAKAAPAEAEARREPLLDKDGREMSPKRAAAAADRIAAREEANARARTSPMGPTALAAIGPDAGATGQSKRETPLEPAEVVVDTPSMEVAVRIVTEWAKVHQIAIESSTLHKDVSRGGRAADAPKNDKADKAAAAKAGEANSERITLVLTSAELSELMLRLNGARETSARLDSAPPSVQGYVAAVMSKPAVLYSVADLEEAGAGAQTPEDKAADDAKKAKEAAASQPAKNSTQPSRPGVEAGPSVRTTITVREGRGKK